jgi:hypothetical protein
MLSVRWYANTRGMPGNIPIPAQCRLSKCNGERHRRSGSCKRFGDFKNISGHDAMPGSGYFGAKVYRSKISYLGCSTVLTPSQVHRLLQALKRPAIPLSTTRPPLQPIASSSKVRTETLDVRKCVRLFKAPFSQTTVSGTLL